MDYRREIDGLRALAVLPVILFHAGFETFSGGFVGVDVFFVISGYLITTIIQAELNLGKFSIVNFYERRLRRILPALFFMMLVCIPLAWCVLFPIDVKKFSQSLIAVSVFVSNMLFWRESGYFDPAAELKPLLHTWSLAVEEQYYLLFPLFLMLSWRFGKRWILILLACFFVVSLSLAQWASIAKPAAAFFLLPTRSWELFIGSFCSFYMSSRKPCFTRGLGETGGWLGLVLIMYSVFTFSKMTPFPGLWALIPTVGAALILMFAGHQTTIGKLLANKAFVSIGLVSYSAYLWHQPLFAFARAYTFSQVNNSLIFLLILITFVFSIFSFKYIETPFRKGSKFSGRVIFKISACGIVLFMAIGVYGNLQDGFLGKVHRGQRVMTEAISDWQHPGRLAKGDTQGFYKYDKTKPIDVLFFGDSHAEQFAPLSIDMANNGKNIGFLSGGGCPPIPNLLDDLHPHCFDLFERFTHILSIEKNIKTIIVAGCFNCYFIQESRQYLDIADKYKYYYLEDGKRLYLRNGAGMGEALKSFGIFIEKLSINTKIIVVGDNPAHYSFDPSVLLAYKLRGDTAYFKTRYPEFLVDEFIIPDWQVGINDKIKVLLNPKIYFINSIEIVCPNGKCKAVSHDGRPFYKDENHMRPEFVRSKFLGLLTNALR